MQDLIVVGMGKLGGRELNVSSDIDLVFLYDGAPRGRGALRARRPPPDPAAVGADRGRLRVPRRHAAAAVRRFRPARLQLRGAGELPHHPGARMGALRLAQGAPAHRRRRRAAALDAIVRPFVFRKYLDYATLAAMRALHAEVRRDVARRELAEHVKLGPGGIREIEFIVQALQLIRGGRDAELRVRPTLRGPAGPGAEESAARERGAASSARPTCSCATSSTACSTSTTRSATTCPRTTRTARASPQMCGSPSWAAFYPAAERIRARRSRGISKRCSPSARQPPEPWPEHPRLAALRASQRYAALPEESRRRLDAPGAGARARRARRRPTPRRRSRAASTWSRRSPAAPPTSRCSPSIPRRSSAWRASSAPRAGRRSSSRAIRCCSTSCSTTGCSTRRSTWLRSRKHLRSAARRGAATTPSGG